MKSSDEFKWGLCTVLYHLTTDTGKLYWDLLRLCATCTRLYDISNRHVSNQFNMPLVLWIKNTLCRNGRVSHMPAHDESIRGQLQSVCNILDAHWKGISGNTISQCAAVMWLFWECKEGAMPIIKDIIINKLLGHHDE